MRSSRWLAPFALAVLLSGCFTRTIAQRMGVSGWFRADLEPRTAGVYRERFAPLALEDPALPCAELTRQVRDATTPLVVLVHGVGGDSLEMEVALASLMATPPASVFMFRWVPYDGRDAVAARLAAGISRLAECVPSSEGRLLILAHSAGGVVSSFAASRIRLPPSTGPTAWVTLITAASPLSGTMSRAARPDGTEESTILLDLGTSIQRYPAAAPGVRVVHLRTHPPADSAMAPYKGHVPNDPSVGVPGAPQLELPDGLDHAGAIEYVAAEVAAGRWKIWRDPAP